MAESSINVTEGSGKRLHTWDRTIASVLVQDQQVGAAMPYYPTYSVPITAISTATGASNILQIMAGSSLSLYIHRVTLWQSASATTAAYCEWSFRRLTTAGTGGTSVPAVVLDQGDAAAGAACMTLPTAKGTEGAVPWRSAAYFTQTPGAAGSPMLPVLDFVADGSLVKPIRVPAGTSNGLAIRNDTAIAGATVTGTLVFTELSYA